MNKDELLQKLDILSKAQIEGLNSLKEFIVSDNNELLLDAQHFFINVEILLAQLAGEIFKS